MIPKILHFVWLKGSPPLPAWAQRNIDEFRRLNPDYQIMMHDGSDLPDCYRDLYESVKTVKTSSDSHLDFSSMADIVRYGVLETHGGWYFDVDYWPMRPVDDIVRAYQLDGSKVFAAYCWENPKNPGYIANAILASTPCSREVLGNGMLCSAPSDSAAAWAAVREMVEKSANEKSRLAFGPIALRRAVEKYPDRFVLAGIQWFNGIRHPWSSMLYRRAVTTGDNSCIRAFAEKTTGGQLPFAMHLWAWKYGDQIGAESGQKTALVLSLPTRTGRTARGGVFEATKAGLEELGYTATMIEEPQGEKDAFSVAGFIPDLMVLWNGRGEHSQKHADMAERFGIPVVRLEVGWFDRSNHFQLDRRGFQYTSTLMERVRDIPPAGASERLRRWVPSIAPQGSKSDGYVLVIGQVTGDSQLIDSEVTTRLDLQRAVMAALAERVDAYYRPHPQSSRHQNHAMPLLELPNAETAREDYSHSKTGQGLVEALAGARFVVTINSSAMHDAMIAGVPCLAFGPSLAIEAGAAKGTTLANLRRDIDAMLDGWHPTDEVVERFLGWLAASQYSRAEIAAGWPIEQQCGEARHG